MHTWQELRRVDMWNKVKKVKEEIAVGRREQYSLVKQQIWIVG